MDPLDGYSNIVSSSNSKIPKERHGGSCERRPKNCSNVFVETMKDTPKSLGKKNNYQISAMAVQLKDDMDSIRKWF